MTMKRSRLCYWIARPAKVTEVKNLTAVSGLLLQFEFTDSYEMIHKTWGNIEKVPYCLPRSSVKFQDHTGQKIANLDPHWAFPECNSILNSQMSMKWCTKLEIAQKRCPVVFEGHLSNFKVTRDKQSPMLTQIWCFRTVTSFWFHICLWNDTQSLK